MDDLPQDCDFLVLGATGMQGRIMTRDLVEKGYSVIISGKNPQALEKLKQKYLIPGVLLDLENYDDLVSLAVKLHPKVIVNCAEGDWNVEVYKAALAAGSHVLDLGSDIPTTKEQFAMDEEFKKRNLIAITGAGSTPGVNNVMLDYASKFFDQIDTIAAGFAWNSNIKTFVVPFSMPSILEEFTDPASVVENNVWLDKTPLDLVTDKSFREVGEQKIFFVRHPEPFTFYENYKSMGAKNVLYYAGFPKHSFDFICSLIPKSGFKSEEADTVFVEGKGEVDVYELTRVLQEMYPAPERYEETENLWVTIDGTKDGNPKSILMECIVPTLPGWEEAGCNIDTGLPAAIMAEMILRGQVKEYGSFAPESVIPHMEFFKELAKRHMIVWMNGQKVLDSRPEEQDFERTFAY